MKKIVLALLFVLSLTSIVNARGWVEQEGGWYYLDSSDEIVTESIQTGGNGAKFYLGEEGMMEKDYFLEDYDGQTYYFGPDGAMVTNMWVAIDSSLVDSDSDYVPEQYWYYFGSNGKAVRGSSDNPKKMVIDGKKYLFNEKGQMCTGWIDENGKVIDPDEGNPFATALYYGGYDNDGVLRSGWVEYLEGYEDGDDWLNDKHVMFFYFNPQSNKKVGFDGATTKIINNKTYAFTGEGVMMSEWDYAESGIEVKGLGNNTINDKRVFFSDENDGHQVKNDWVYTVPSENLDAKDYEDGKEKWFYFNNSGKSEYDTIKKISNKYYAFDKDGIMQTGFIVWCTSDKQYDMQLDGKVGKRFICKIDMDNATGEEIIKKGILRYGEGDNDYIKVNPKGMIAYADGQWYNNETYNPENPSTDMRKDKIVLQYFNAKGERETGTNNVQLDETYTFVSNSRGDVGSGLYNKKYYSLGFLLKASPDIKYGIVSDYSYYFANGEPGSVADVDASPANGSFDIKNGTFSPQKDCYGQQIVRNILCNYPTKDQDPINGVNGGNGENVYKVVDTSGKVVKGNKMAKKDADGNYWFINPDTDRFEGIWSVPVKKMDGTLTYKGTYKIKVADLQNPPAAIYAGWTGGPLLENYTEGASSLKIKKDLKAMSLVDPTDPAWSSSEPTFIMKPYEGGAVAVYDSVIRACMSANIGCAGETGSAPGGGPANPYAWAEYLTFNIVNYKNANPDKHTYDLNDYIICKVKFTVKGGLFYKTEYDDKQQWVPFGVKDDSGRCASHPFMSENVNAWLMDKGAPWYDCYQIEPTNDYFLNCYWDE